MLLPQLLHECLRLRMQAIDDDGNFFCIMLVEDAHQSLHEVLPLKHHKRFGQFHSLFGKPATLAGGNNSVFHLLHVLFLLILIVPLRGSVSARRPYAHAAACREAEGWRVPHRRRGDGASHQ